MPSHRTPAARRWPVAALPLVAAGLLVLGLVGWFGQGEPAGAAVEGDRGMAAAAAGAAAAPTTVSKGKRTVTVDPPTGIPDESAAITVTGSGFGTDDDLWVAICQDDGQAPANLTHCLGGAIPDQNSTTSWGVVTDERGDAPPGPVVTEWDDAGGFSMTLQVLGGADQQADCVQQECSVYVRSATDKRNADVVVPIAFAAPDVTTSSASTSTSTSSASSQSTSSEHSSTSSEQSTTSSEQSTTSSESSTSSAEPTTTAPVPTTVNAQSVLLDEVEPGRHQVIVFAGFTPGEQATVTLSGNPPVELPAVEAGAGGNVRVEWSVPQDFPPGGYTMRVEGLESLRVGQASFTVVAAPASSTAVSTSDPATSNPVTPSEPASSPVTSPGTSSAHTSQTSRSEITSPADTATSSSESAAPPVPDDGAPADAGSSTPWWLWVILAAILLIGLVVGAVALARRHRQETDAERQQRETELAAAADAEANRHGTAQPPPPPAQSGYTDLDEHPDRPFLFSHQQPESHQPPTEVIGGPQAPTEAIRPDQQGPVQPGQGQQPPNQQGPGQQNPGTQRFDPFADDTAAGPGAEPPASPGTQRFDPFADDATETGPDAGPDADDDDPTDRGGWSPPGQ